MRGRWLALGMLWLLAWTAGGSGPGTPGRPAWGASREAAREPAGAGARAVRRRWALAKMDEMANERLRCRDRFTRPRQVRECEVEHTRRYREYNEIYLEASRE